MRRRTLNSWHLWAELIWWLPIGQNIQELMSIRKEQESYGKKVEKDRNVEMAVYMVRIGFKIFGVSGVQRLIICNRDMERRD